MQYPPHKLPPQMKLILKPCQCIILPSNFLILMVVLFYFCSEHSVKKKKPWCWLTRLACLVDFYSALFQRSLLAHNTFDTNVPRDAPVSLTHRTPCQVLAGKNSWASTWARPGRSCLHLFSACDKLWTWRGEWRTAATPLTHQSWLKHTERWMFYHHQKRLKINTQKDGHFITADND